MTSLGLRYHKNRLTVLDQTLLPHQEHWIDIETPQQMVNCIKKLQVRGAPLIGVAAALALGHACRNEISFDDLVSAARDLRNSRPTAVNLMYAIDQILDGLDRKDFRGQVIQRAEALFQEDVDLCEGMANHGSTLIEEGDSILTHCNAGGLATAGRGTAVGVLQRAFEQRKKIHVFVDETRPLLQGGRLTAWELKQYGVPYTLICDNMAAHLMREGRIQKVMVGADRIARNGDFANKIGTYSLAVLAHHHKIPFFVVAPRTTLDPKCSDGSQIPIEQRDPNEVLGVSGSFGKVVWAPIESAVLNPAFDVTPHNLVTGFVLDNGVFPPDQII